MPTPSNTVLRQKGHSRTPVLTRKLSKTNVLATGKEVINQAINNDLEKRAQSEERIVSGFSKKTGGGLDDHVEDLWAQQDVDDYHEVKKAVSEATYKSTPLGRSHNRGHKLPGFMLDDHYRHGVITSKSVVAKQLIYSNAEASGADAENNYIKSHGSYKPGQQLRRNYNWPVNIECSTFGIKLEKGSDRGSSFGVAQALQMKDGSDEAAYKNKKTNHPDKIFGKSTSQETSSAAKCLQHPKEAKNLESNGFHSEDLDDLGKSVTHGFRNAFTERCFGCPSIRSDIPRYDRSSIADTQNYCDAVCAGYLLRPSLFSSYGLENNEFGKPRSKEFLETVFLNCDLKIDDKTFESTFHRVADSNGCASIESFRSLLYELVDKFTPV